MPSLVKLKPEATALDGPLSSSRDESPSQYESQSDEDDEGVTLGADEVMDEPAPKKRKRDEAEDDLEINVNLPEPPSKKALRKAKKGKVSSRLEGSNEDQIASKAVEASGLEAAESAPAPKSDKAAYGVWIGNLPWSIDKPMISKFLTDSSTITKEHITRVHLPAPQNAQATKTSLKPRNKGFAYVDFTTADALTAALALSETQLGGRNLLIKDAKSFAGRPKKEATEQSNGEAKTSAAAKAGQKPPSRRVFVGNLGFDVTKEDLTEHFGLCGEVENIHMATFEDTGKCKGFAWATFAAEFDMYNERKTGEQAAEDAVKGYTFVRGAPGSKDDDKVMVGPSDSEEEKKPAKKPKKSKWFVNRLQGRTLRCEFAEDPTTRYKKRHGKAEERSQQRGSKARAPQQQTQVGEVEDIIVPTPDPGQPKSRPDKKRADDFLSDIRPGAPNDASRRRGKRQQDPREAETRYRTGAIAEATGSKVTF